MDALQSRLDRHKAESRSTQDPAVTAVLESSIERLRESHPPSRYIALGDVFPDFTLPDHTGEPVHLAEFLARGPVVLSFYRGLWCPYCNLELEALGEAYDQIRALGADLIAISPQSAANSSRAVRINELPFRILTDAGNAIADSAGLRYRLEPALVEMYTRLGVNLPLINRDDSWTLPIPARIVLTSEGRVYAINADPDYTQRPEPSETLRALQSMASTAAGG